MQQRFINVTTTIPTYMTAIYIPQSSCSAISFRSGFQKPRLSEVSNTSYLTACDRLTGRPVRIIYYPFPAFTDFVSLEVEIQIIYAQTSSNNEQVNL